MNITKTNLPGLLLIEPDIFRDKRGYFFESYHSQKLKALGINTDFVQDNESMSMKDVLRGLHFQHPPYTQGKLVRVVRGSVQDIAVDIRKGSPTFGMWFSEILSEKNKLMMWIPEGFAHGFLVLENHTVFQYKCTNFYSQASERTILWNDPDLKIEWMTKLPIVSAKDLKGSHFREYESPFIYPGK